jgi:hypothetical protein
VRCLRIGPGRLASSTIRWEAAHVPTRQNSLPLRFDAVRCWGHRFQIWPYGVNPIQHAVGSDLPASLAHQPLFKKKWASIAPNSKINPPENRG